LKILQNLTKGVGAAVKSDIDKMIRNIVRIWLYRLCQKHWQKQ